HLHVGDVGTDGAKVVDDLRELGVEHPASSPATMPASMIVGMNSGRVAVSGVRADRAGGSSRGPAPCPPHSASLIHEIRAGLTLAPCSVAAPAVALACLAASVNLIVDRLSAG